MIRLVVDAGLEEVRWGAWSPAGSLSQRRERNKGFQANTVAPRRERRGAAGAWRRPDAGKGIGTIREDWVITEPFISTGKTGQGQAGGEMW